VRLQAGGGDLSVAEPGEAGAVDVVGEDAAVGVGGGLGAVVLQNVGQDLQGGGLGCLGGVAAVFQDLGPRAEVVGNVVGGRVKRCRGPEQPGMNLDLVCTLIDERAFLIRTLRPIC
jgi:hypothetical protein